VDPVSGALILFMAYQSNLSLFYFRLRQPADFYRSYSVVLSLPSFELRILPTLSFDVLFG